MIDYNKITDDDVVIELLKELHILQIEIDQLDDKAFEKFTLEIKAQQQVDDANTSKEECTLHNVSNCTVNMLYNIKKL